jgi:predicted O-methyltransferase YrrM
MLVKGLIGHRPRLFEGASGKRLPLPRRLLQAVMPGSERQPWLAATTPRGRWNNAVALELTPNGLGNWPADDGLVVACGVRVHEGRLGIGLVKQDGATYASRERTLAADPAIQRARIWVDEPSHARSLLFRNVDPEGRPTRFDVFDLLADRLPGEGSFAAAWSHPSVKAIDVRELGRLVAWARRVWDDPFGPASPRQVHDGRQGSIAIVNVGDLPSSFGQASPPAWPPPGQNKPLDGWKMETDDAPILEYLWRMRRPRRHLEFGTWEGFGAVLVGQSTDAEIWTINLAEGEAGSDGESLYARSDAGGNIGRLYRSAGLAERVHQLLCDSRAFKTGDFAADFSDTVLIDGGHTPELVENDTDKALAVLRPGGLCVWHDFCPDPAALSRNLAPLGVVQAIVDNFARWRPLFDRLYWIRKSWILVGERKAA